MESTAVQTQEEEYGDCSEGCCDARLYDELSSYVATPAFLKAFEQNGSTSKPQQQRAHSTPAPGSQQQQQSHTTATPSNGGGGTSTPAGAAPGSGNSECDSVASASAPRGDQDSSLHATSSSDAEQQQPEASYVFVQQEDAVQAMAFYLAQCIAAHPEAQKLAPKQLQDALSNTLQGLKQTRFKTMCTYGRSAYRWSALTYSALQMYQNPWLIRAILTTIWAFSKLGMRAFL